MTLLVVGDPDDLTAVYVRHRAGRRGAEVILLPEDRLGLGWALVGRDRGLAGSMLLTTAGERALTAIKGAFVRLYHDPPVPPELGLDLVAAAAFREQRRGAVHAFLRQLPCAVVNRPSAGHSNGAKPLQMRELAAAGLDVPDWLVTNEAGPARAFAARWPEGAVVKSCSGLRSEVRALDEECLDRLAAGSPPVLVQARVAGHDVRLHVVGRLVFATHISGGEGIDYRFHSHGRHYEAGRAPPWVVRKAVLYARAQGLALAGFDFRVDPGGRWWCLECNPVPTFLPYEMSTGQPIADAVLDLVLGPVPGGRLSARPRHRSARVASAPATP